MEIRVLRLDLEQRVGLLQRRARIAEQQGSLRIAILGGKPLGRLAEHARRGSLSLGVDGDLGAHHVVAQLQGFGIDAIVVGAGFRQLLEVGDAVARHRMADLIGVHAGARERQRVLEPLESNQHALGRLPRRLEIGDRRSVGGRFLGALIAKQAAAGEFAAAGGDAGARLGQAARACGGSRCDCADAEQRCDDRHGLGARELIAQTVLVAAGDVAGLMGDDADDLVGGVGLQQRAGVDEHAAAGDEGVEAWIVDEDDVDARFREPGSLEDRPRIVAHQGLDFRVAHDRHVALGKAFDRAGRGQQHGKQQRGCGAGASHCGSDQTGHSGNHR